MIYIDNIISGFEVPNTILINETNIAYLADMADIDDIHIKSCWPIRYRDLKPWEKGNLQTGCNISGKTYLRKYMVDYPH